MPTMGAFYGALVTESTPGDALERVRPALPKATPSSTFRRLLEKA